MGYQCTILADSLSPAGVRLTTLEITFPRIVLAEFNTHRMLSRNSASSRAIPVEKRIRMVEEDPFIPEQFGRNRPGMQATDILEAELAFDASLSWQRALAAAIKESRILASLGVHKQLANRLLEPFLWHTVIVSATEWSNFFALRCHPDAQPEIRKIAEMMRDTMASSEPTMIGYDDWHLPLVPDLEELQQAEYDYWDIAMISAGRCARVSYLTHDGRRDPKADIELAERLKAAGHMSPFEHIARPIALDDSFCGNFRGWIQLRKHFPGESDFSKVTQ